MALLCVKWVFAKAKAQSWLCEIDSSSAQNERFFAEDINKARDV